MLLLLRLLLALFALVVEWPRPKDCSTLSLCSVGIWENCVMSLYIKVYYSGSIFGIIRGPIRLDRAFVSTVSFGVRQMPLCRSASPFRGVESESLGG